MCSYAHASQDLISTTRIILVAGFRDGIVERLGSCSYRVSVGVGFSLLELSVAEFVKRRRF